MTAAPCHLPVLRPGIASQYDCGLLLSFVYLRLPGQQTTLKGHATPIPKVRVTNDVSAGFEEWQFDPLAEGCMRTGSHLFSLWEMKEC